MFVLSRTLRQVNYSRISRQFIATALLRMLTVREGQRRIKFIEQGFLQVL